MLTLTCGSKSMHKGHSAALRCNSDTFAISGNCSCSNNVQQSKHIKRLRLSRSYWQLLQVPRGKHRCSCNLAQSMPQLDCDSDWTADFGLRTADCMHDACAPATTGLVSDSGICMDVLFVCLSVCLFAWACASASAWQTVFCLHCWFVHPLGGWRFPSSSFPVCLLFKVAIILYITPWQTWPIFLAAHACLSSVSSILSLSPYQTLSFPRVGSCWLEKIIWLDFFH